MHEIIEKTILTNDLIRSGDRVLIALSGGADSVFMTEVLRTLAPKMGFDIAAAHYNHGIRGENADRDEEFVRQLCRRLQIPLFTEKGDVPSFARECGTSIETAARLKRYEFLRRILKQADCKVIATAHHLDDNAESILLHLLRGSGTRGLCGMKYASGDIIHPLLDVRRSDIEAYLEENGIGFVTDETNFKDDCSRNALRLRILPELEKSINPAVKEAIVRCGRIIGEDEAFLMREAEEAFGKIAEVMAPGRTALKRKQLCLLPLPVKKRVIRLALESVGVMSDVEYKHILAVTKLAEAESGAKLDIPHAAVQVDFDRLVFKRCMEGEKNAMPIGQTLENACGQTVKIARELIPTDFSSAESFTAANGKLTFSLYDLGSCFPKFEKNTAFLDMEKLKFPLEIRTRQPGDRIRPANSAGTKKLKDYFIANKISADRRDGLPLLLSDGEIVFVPGLCTAESAKIDEKTRLCLRVEWEGFAE